jgi:predicted nucleic acid-binding protein
MVTSTVVELMLDATVFEDYRHGDPGARDIFERIISGEIKASVLPVTVARLWASPDMDRRVEIGYSGMLSFVGEAQLSLEASKKAGAWAASTSEPSDSVIYHALVAAAAQERGETICTRDPEPFLRFYSQVIEY